MSLSRQYPPLAIRDHQRSIGTRVPDNPRLKYCQKRTHGLLLQPNPQIVATLAALSQMIRDVVFLLPPLGIQHKSRTWLVRLVVVRFP